MYNVQNYFVEDEPLRTHVVQSPKSEEKREAVAEVIASAKPAVVGLIEMGGELALRDLQARLAARGLDYPHSRILMRDGEARALAILSLYPIVADASQADVPLQGERRMMRGLLDVSIQAPDERIFRLMGVHLKSRYDANADAAEDLRRSEAYHVAQHVQKISKTAADMPLLVFGDWNDSPADSSVQIIIKGLSSNSALKRLRPRDSRGENWTLHFRSGHEYCLYDHLFVNKTLAERMNKSNFCGIVDIPASTKASDHRALWCDLR